MPVRNEYQMIDQFDVHRAQEKRRILRGPGIGGARPGVARRMIVRHDDGVNMAAEQAAPASRRDDAAAGVAPAGAFEVNKPIEGIESRKQRRFTLGSKIRVQQMTRHVIFGFLAMQPARSDRPGFCSMGASKVMQIPMRAVVGDANR
jgi:hypothetical protein